MSDEEIQFEDVAYREPQKARRPDLDPRLACIAYRVPGPGELPIFLDRKPADAIERHALRDTSVELGGILLGRECLDEATGSPFVWVTEALEAKHYENTQASFTYTHDSWEEITRERDAKYPDLDIVGWYHTHPDFGIFLSSHDLFIHHNFFDQPLQVAYVVDPIRQDRGFFQWRDGQMIQVGGFWLTAGRADRMALARLVNELEGIPAAEGVGGGGGLSPRLEAELFAMLSRSQTVAVAADRGQSAAVFSLLGVALGALAVVAILWLQTLGKTLQDQEKAIEAIAKAQEKSVVATKDLVAEERISAKEAALDAILHDIKIDPAAPKLSGKLTALIAQRDEAKKAATRLAVEKEALTDLVARIEEREHTNKLRADAALQKLEGEEKSAREEADRYSKELEALKDKERLYEDNVSGSLQRKYNWAWYLALIGWGACGVCGVALAAALSRREEDDQPAPPLDGPTVSIT